MSRLFWLLGGLVAPGIAILAVVPHTTGQGAVVWLCLLVANVVGYAEAYLRREP